MNTEVKKGMPVWAMVIIAIFVVFLMSILSVISYVVDVRDSAVAEEQALITQKDKVAIVMGTYSNKIAEMAQVPKMYIQGVRDTYADVLSNRYGPDGVKAMFLFLKEKNPNIPDTMYVKLQQVMEAGRNEIAVEQKFMMDKKNNYAVNLDLTVRGSVLKALGFPRVKLDDFQPIVNSRTKEAIRTNTEEAIQLN